jgi:hypothetical protein
MVTVVMNGKSTSESFRRRPARARQLEAVRKEEKKIKI